MIFEISNINCAIEIYSLELWDRVNKYYFKCCLLHSNISEILDWLKPKIFKLFVMMGVIFTIKATVDSHFGKETTGHSDESEKKNYPSTVEKQK